MRPSSGSPGPLGGDSPLVTEQGHFVIEFIFTLKIEDPSKKKCRTRKHDLGTSLNWDSVLYSPTIKYVLSTYGVQ